MTAEELKSELRARREALFASIRGLSEEQFRFAPAGEQWNVAAHLAHLLRIERVFGERGAAALREDEPFCPSTAVMNDDDPALAQHLAVPQIIHGMQAARRDLEVLLDTGNASLTRAIVHERIGRMTVEEIVKKMAGHEREHTESIAVVARQALNARPVTIPLTRRS
jgi:uncharacterized damage-inducible protein DinB